MWKIVNGQWIAITEDERQEYLQADSKYCTEWSNIRVNHARIEIKARQEESQVIGWRAEISIGGKAAYWAKVYIDRFPDLLTFLNDINGLDKLGL